MSLFSSAGQPDSHLVTYPPSSTERGVYLFDGIGNPEVFTQVPSGAERHPGQRFVKNLATGLTTQTIIVQSGNEYHVYLKGDTGSTAVCSGAFTGTLTGVAGQGTGWGNGTPKVSSGISLTVTITGTLTEFSIVDVTNKTNKLPPEYVSVGVGQGLELVEDGGFDLGISQVIPIRGAFISHVGNELEVTTEDPQNFGSGGLTISTKPGDKYIISGDLKFVSTSAAHIVKSDSLTGHVNSVSTIGISSPQDKVTLSFVATANITYIWLGRNGSNSPAQTTRWDNVTCKNAAHATTGIDGAKYFLTANDNVSVDANGVVTRTGSSTAILNSDMPGVFMEGVGGNLKPSLLTSYGINGSPGISVSHGTVTAPDGSNNTALITVINSTLSFKYLRGGNTSIAGDYVSTFYVKHVNHPYVGIRQPGSGAYIRFNLVTGLVEFSASANNIFVEAVGDGWFKVSVAATLASDSFIFNSVAIMPSGSTSEINTMVGGEQVLVAMPYFEAGVVPQSYTSLTSRAADNDLQVPISSITDGTEDRNYQLYLTPSHDFSDLPAADHSIISLDGSSTTALLYHKANHTLASHDGTTSVESSQVVVGGVTIKVNVEFLTSGVVNIYINDTLTGTSAWDLDNNSGAIMHLCKGYTFGMSMKDMRILG
jgi:hypothetical protein